jgi:hypothetical protein
VKLTRGVKAGLGVAALVGVTLVPLYGDPRVSRVSHAEWARMLLEGLDLAAALPRATPASMVFSVLSWKTNLKQSAERYVRADGIELVGDPARQVRAVADPGEVGYALAVARAGDYRVRVRLAGSSAATATVALARVGDTSRAIELSVRPPAGADWVDAGVAHLGTGAWTASVSLPAGTLLDAIEIAPPCLNPIEPLSGWRAPRVTDTVDLAVTVLKALDLESELPPSDAPLDIPASAFRSGEPQALNVASATSVDGYTVAGGSEGLRVEVSVEVPERGLYTLMFFGRRGAGQRWAADGCHKVIVCGVDERDHPAAWHALGTLELTAGRHLFNVALGAGATLERLRLVRHKDTGEDYLATLRRLGFDPGPDGPITRAKAEEAIDFLRRRRHERPTPDCGDWDLTLPGSIVADGNGNFPGPPPPVPGPPPPPGNSGNGPPPITPPDVPPQDPASPVELGGAVVAPPRPPARSAGVNPAPLAAR